MLQRHHFVMTDGEIYELILDVKIGFCPGSYSCGLSTATIEYSCPSVCLPVCVHDNSKNNGSIDLKLEHVVVYENSSD